MGMRVFFRRRNHLTPMINIIFFITYLMLNIFMLNDFFGKSVFLRKLQKTVLGEPECNKPLAHYFNPRCKIPLVLKNSRLSPSTPLKIGFLRFSKILFLFLWSGRFHLREIMRPMLQNITLIIHFLRLRFF